MKFVANTTLIHGTGKEAKTYQPGDVIDLPEKQGAAIQALTPVACYPAEPVMNKKDAAQVKTTAQSFLDAEQAG